MAWVRIPPLSASFWPPKETGDTGDWTRDISHAKRALYHWATSPPIGCYRYVTNWGPVGLARLAEWSKAWDLSSHNRKIAWVRTPHLANNFFFTTWGALNCFVSHLDWLQWRNRLAHGTYRQCNEKCRGCEFEPHLEQVFLWGWGWGLLTRSLF